MAESTRSRLIFRNGAFRGVSGPARSTADAATRPRVLFVTRTSERTGPTNSLFELLRSLRERFDASVLLPGCGEFTDRLEDADVPFVSFPSLRKRALPGMISLLRRGRFDLVYGNETSSGAKNALIAAKVARIPFVYHVRAMCHGGSWRKVGFLRFADAVIAVSQATARSVHPYVRFAPEVVYNGVAMPPAEPAPVSARVHLREMAALPENALVMVAVGNVQPRKGQEFAIRALSHLSGRHPSLHLVLAGRLDRDPAYAARMRALTGDLGLESRVHFLGFQPDIWRILRGSDLLVHPTVEDPHPRAVIEAMAVGLPVVATDADGVSETVVHGRTGLLVPPRNSAALAEAIATLVESASVRREFGRHGQIRARARFSAEETARRVGDVLEGALRRRGSRHRIPAATSSGASSRG